MKKLVIVACAVAAFAVQAKTVALWPMEKDEVRNQPNMRCAISSANGFSTVPAEMTFEETTIGWNLPPNPDTTANKLFSVTSYWDFVSDPTSTMPARNIFRVDTPEISELMKLRHDFTLEGWFKPWDVENQSWHLIFHANGGGTGNFTWQIRNNEFDKDGNRILGFYLYAGYAGVGDTLVGSALTAAEAIDLTNRWHHIALTFKADTGKGLGRFTMYYDGQKRGTVDTLKVVDDFTPQYTYQTFGGRNSGAVLRARWNYWRLSDTVLTPEELLNYGGTGTVVAKPETPEIATTETIAYWKLGVNEDGMIDGHDYVGDYDLSRGLIDYCDGKSSIEAEPCYSTMAASADRPFVQPPNTTVTIPNGQRGCFRGGNATSADILIEGAGSGLDLDQDFTVEAYVRFLQNEGWLSRYTQTDGYVFGTVYCRGDQRWVLVWEYSSQMLYMTSYNLAQKKGYYFGSFCKAPSDAAWHHLALLHDATANSWTLYIDGKAVGTVNHSAEDTVQSAGYFGIFGRGSPINVPCEIASLRVSKTKLAADQFLCESANPKAATDVVAFWPLDTPDGVTLDGRDIAGSYAFTHGAFDGDDYRVTAVTNDQPVITNPERKLGVYMHPGSATKGSVRFRDGDKGRKSFLYFGRLGLTQKLRGATTEWTLEFYTKRAAAPDGGDPGDIIFVTGPGPSNSDYQPSPNNGHLTLTYRKDGFAVFDRSVAEFRRTVSDKTINIYTVACTESADSIPIGEWAHVAVTRAHNNGTVTYTFYVNGVKKGTMSGTIDSDCPGEVTLFGGSFDYWGAKPAWNGIWSSMRLTKGVLAPADFLCATPATPIPEQEEETLAYWAFDYRNSTLDLLSRSVYQYSPFKTDYSLVAGSDDQSVGRPANPVAALPIPSQRNHGSASLTRGAVLTYPGLAEKLSYNRAFTVEGWLRWTAAATDKEEILFGACGNASVAHAWRVYVDYSGTTPALKIYGNAPSGDYGAVVGDTIVADISSWNGVWKHLALVYDPAVGNFGTWKLYVDCQLAGTLENAWYPGLTPWTQNDFVIGSAATTTATGFTGLVDEWRIVTKPLASDDLLKEGIRGTSLILR